MNSEHKKQKFINLANKRVNKALKQIKLISNLSNKNNYDFTTSEVRQIIEVLEKELQVCKDSFDRQLKEDKTPFKLT